MVFLPRLHGIAAFGTSDSVRRLQGHLVRWIGSSGKIQWKALPTKDVEVRSVDKNVVFHDGVPDARDFQLWETCMTINHTWAYNANDRNFKSPQDLIRGLIEVTSRGGNFLLNIGPQPDGMVQPEFQERLHAIGDWLEVNGEAIYGSTYGPIQGN